jgi:hypothetical protein
VRIAAATLVALTLEACAAEGDRLLVLPRHLQPGETAVIEVQVGGIVRGQEIHITTDSGRELGVISPFGVKSGQPAGTYPIPVPPGAVEGRDVTVHLTITGNGAQPRAPTAQEIRSVEIVIGGTAADPSGHQGEKK